MEKSEAVRLSQVAHPNPKTSLHRSADWGAVKADLVRRTGLSRLERHLALDEHAFMINLRGDARSGENFIDGRRVEFTPRRAGSMVYIPAHREWSGWDEGDATGSYLFVSVSRMFVENTVGLQQLRTLKPEIGFRDRIIESSLQGIVAEVLNPDQIGVVMVESQVKQLLVQLVRRNASQPAPLRGGLSTFHMKRVAALVEERLVDPPTLDELARLTNFSRRHFIRAFKQSTGKTPHAFIIDYRLKKALELLRTTGSPATVVALETGFGSPSHFSASFRKRYAITPTEYRRNWFS